MKDMCMLLHSSNHNYKIFGLDCTNQTAIKLLKCVDMYTLIELSIPFIYFYSSFVRVKNSKLV